jgi:hypothetical protein
MAQTPEGRVKDKVKRLLKKHGAYQFWPVQMGYGAATLDCLGCHNGHFFGIETKAPGKKPTPRQRLTMDDMREANGAVFVIGERGSHDSGYSGMDKLETWLNLVGQ